MSLAPGAQLGAYEITGPLGAGGMGEVYRARDPELEREVAIKVLPPSFSSDADRVARFEQEAKTLAALNHPNIAHIYGVVRGAGVTGLVMELIEGTTLADRIAEGPLPADEALGIALQIANALEVAHARGIVHRDLKPANIKLKGDGTVKVLDFGIAKALAPEVTGMSSPIMTTPVTQIGVILGTAAYMSPEQARGKAVDQRTDIWAFGCLLYEMLTGQLAFSGEDVAVIMARVIANDTDMSSLPKLVSPAVRHTIALCLQKDPAKRIADIRDVRLALAGAFESDGLVRASAVAAAVPLWRRPLATGAAMLVVGALLAALAAFIFTPVPAEPPVNRFAIDWPEDIVGRRLGENIVALAPDGRHFVLNTEAGLYLRAMDTLEGRLLPGTEEDLHTPFFSPDGRQIAYWTATRQLKRIGIGGGAPVVIAGETVSGEPGVAVGNVRGGSWAPDNTILLATNQGILRVPASGGTFELLFEPGENEAFQAPSLLPDGDGVLFSVIREGDWIGAQIVVQSIATGERKVLIEGGHTPRYVATGHLVYAIGTDLFGIAFAADGLLVSGSVVPLAQGIAQSLTAVAGLSNYGVADDGTLLYLAGAPEDALSLTPFWVDRDGQAEIAANIGCICLNAMLSPDGTRLAITQLDLLSGEGDVWVFSFAQQTLTRLTFASGVEATPVWSPDSRRIAYAGEAGLFVQNADGTGSPERLFEDEAYPLSWSDDGEILYGFSREGSAVFDLGALAVDGDPAPRAILPLGGALLRAEWSPDKRWLAYESAESDRKEIYVRPYPEVDSGRWQVSSAGGEDPHWSPDGSALYFLGPGEMMKAVVEPGESFRFVTPSPVFATDGYVLGANIPRLFEVAADGERLLMFRLDQGIVGLNSLIVVQNWTEELERLVPAD